MLAGWLHGLQELRAPQHYDRTILDGIHAELPKRSRSSPLLLAVSVPCLLIAGLANFYPRQTVPAPQAARAVVQDVSRPTLVARAPVSLPAPRVAEREAPGLVQTKRPPLRTARLLGAAAPVASRPMAPKLQRLAAQTIAAPAVPLVPALPPPAVEVAVAAVSAPAAAPTSVPSAQIMPAALSGSGMGIALAMDQRSEQLSTMLRTTEYVAVHAKQRQGNRRPLYKRAWFWGVVGAAATGVAAGITAAVMTANQAPHDLTASTLPLIQRVGPS